MINYTVNMRDLKKNRGQILFAPFHHEPKSYPIAEPVIRPIMTGKNDPLWLNQDTNWESISTNWEVT